MLNKFIVVALLIGLNTYAQALDLNLTPSEIAVESCKANISNMVLKAKAVRTILLPTVVLELDELYSINLKTSQNLKMSKKKISERKNLLEAIIFEARKLDDEQDTELLNRFVSVIQSGCYRV